MSVNLNLNKSVSKVTRNTCIKLGYHDSVSKISLVFKSIGSQIKENLQVAVKKTFKVSLLLSGGIGFGSAAMAALTGVGVLSSFATVPLVNFIAMSALVFFVLSLGSCLALTVIACSIKGVIEGSWQGGNRNLDNPLLLGK